MVLNKSADILDQSSICNQNNEINNLNNGIPVDLLNPQKDPKMHNKNRRRKSNLIDVSERNEN